jgi:hypothetical protein
MQGPQRWRIKFHCTQWGWKATSPGENNNCKAPNGGQLNVPLHTFTQQSTFGDVGSVQHLNLPFGPGKRKEPGFGPGVGPGVGTGVRVQD